MRKAVNQVVLKGRREFEVEAPDGAPLSVIISLLFLGKLLSGGDILEVCREM